MEYIFKYYFFTSTFTVPPAAGTLIVPLTSMYELLWSHKFDLIIDVYNLMLLLSYFLRDSSIISTQFFVVNSDCWFVISSNKFIIFSYSNYYIIMLYYYINLRSSVIYFFNLRSAIILCLSSEGISLSLDISSSFFSELFCGDVFFSNQNASCFCCLLNHFFWRSFKYIFYMFLEKYLVISQKIHQE